MSERLLEVRDLKVHFPVKHKKNRFVKAVDGVSFELNRGEILSLVGESGSGKTTTGKAILRIIDPTAGSTRFMDTEIGAERTDETIGHDRLHKAGRLLGALFALATFLPFFLVPGAATKPEKVPVSILTLVKDGVSYGAEGFLGPFILLAALCAVATVVMCLVIKKRITLSAIPAGIGILALLICCISLGRELSLGLGFVAAILTLVLSALSLTVCHGLYTPPFEKELRKHAQMIFQDPYQSLNPRHYIIDIVAEPLDVNGLVTTAEEREQRVVQALERAGIQPARDYLYRYPYELSGGQRQRVAIAASMIMEPDFIVADEPVSMIDASVRLGIIKLIKKMQMEQNISFLFITHDLSLAWLISDRIAIMYLGRIVEIGTADQIIKDCRHPYARALMDVMPIPGITRTEQRTILQGDIPSAADDIKGCRFASRCPKATPRCFAEEPALRDVDTGHQAACWELEN